MNRSFLLLSFAMVYCGNIIASDPDADIEALSSNLQGTQLYGHCPGAPQKGVRKPHAKRDARQANQRNVRKNLALQLQATKANVPRDSGDIEDLAANSRALLNSHMYNYDSEVSKLLTLVNREIPTFAMPIALPSNTHPVRLPLRDRTVNIVQSVRGTPFSSSTAFKPVFKNQ